MKRSTRKIRNNFLSLDIFTFFLFIVFTTKSAFAAVYLLPKPGDDVVGHLFTVRSQSGDTIESIRMKYEISSAEILQANPHLKFAKLKPGTPIIIPTQHILPKYRQGIVINKAELRLYYFLPNTRYVYTFPVAMGREGWRTPTTVTKIVKKAADPVWNVPKSIQAYTLEKHNIWLPDTVPPGPKNPLGKYALYLAKHGYLIHGTNEPASVGTYASSGCMRLASDSVELLYENAPVGTPVYILHHTYKSGWLNGKLYLEAHRHVDLHPEDEESLLNYTDVHDVIAQALKLKLAEIDWRKVRAVTEAKDGLPHVIGTMF